MSSSPAIIMNGTFCSWALRIFFCIRSSESSTSTRSPRAFICSRDVVQVVVVPLRDRDALHLHRREPGRERAGVVLDQHADEPLDRPELGGVDHHRLLAGAVGGLVLQPEPGRLAEVVLHRRHLPGAADRVARLHGDLRTVERRAAGVGHHLEARLVGDLLEDRGGDLPVLVGALELVLVLVVAGRQLEVEVVEAEVAEQPEAEVQQVLDLAGGLLLGDVGVRVVLGHPAHAGQTVHHTGLLEPVDAAELEEPQRQLTVGPAPGLVDEVVHRAAHRLEPVLGVLELHGRVHGLGVVRQVPGGVEQPLLGDVRGADVLEPLLDVPLPDVVLHHPLDDAALGVEDREAGPELVGEGVEVEVAAELAVVALLGLLDPVEVRLQRLLRLPGGAVDALELLVLLVAAPVRRGACASA